MARKVRTTMLELEDGDREILDKLSEHLRTPRATILRWALRHYALMGSWAVGMSEVRDLFGEIAAVDLGPNRRRAI